MGITSERMPLGMLFAFALAVSWTLVTAAMVMAVTAERDLSGLRAASWLSLWVFSVLVPTLNAFSVQRLLRVLGDRDDGERRELSRLRALLLLTANMALLSALALIVGR